MPVLGQNRAFFESAAICLAAGSPLPPVRRRALLSQWLFFGITEIEPAVRLAAERASPGTQGASTPDAQTAAPAQV